MPSSLRRPAAAALLAATLAAPPAARAATLSVPAQYPTIQAAMDAARNGDVVSVAAGRYVERIVFSGRATYAVEGAGAGLTVIDGGQAGTTVTFTSSSATLRGVTVTGGRNYQYDGGGILLDGGSPVVEDCVVEGNVAGSGAGIAIAAGTPVIRRNVVRENVEGCGSGCQGGGILVGFWVTGSPQIVENLVERNTSERGAGIAVESGNPLIERNVVRDNLGDPINGGTQGGEGIYVGAAAELVGNLVEGNERGGIVVGTLFSSDIVLLVNNTVVGNGAAAALAARIDGGTVEAVNNVLASDGPAVSCFGDAVATAVLRNNVVFGAGGAHAAGCGLAGGSSAGNLTVDPLLVDPASGNFRLRPSSPAVNAGTPAMPSGVTLPATDLDGAARVQEGTVDRGAFEYRGLTAVATPALLVDFGPQRVGTASGARTLSFSNAGPVPLHVSDLSISGDYAFTSDCRGPAGIPPGQGCTATVTFHPTARFARAGALVLRGNVGRVNGSPASSTAEIAVTVDLAGTGIAPHVVLSTASLDFGAQRVGTTGGPRPVVVTNDGEVDLVVISVALAAPFAAAPSGCAVVPSGGSCTVDATFAPAARGTFTGTLTVESDAIDGPSTVAVSGRGVAGVASLDRSSVAFGDVRVGEGGTPQAVTLTNGGDAPLALASISATGAGFSVTHACPAVLQPAEGCALELRYAAGAAGAASGTVAIVHDGIGGSRTLSLSASAVDFRVYFYSDDAVVARGGSTSYGLVLERTGTLPFSFPVALSCAGLPAGAICAFSPSSTVAPGYQSVLTMQVSVPAGALGGRGAATLGLFLLPLGALARGARRRGIALGLLLLALAGSLACGGGGGGDGGTPNPDGTTTYTVTVTATSGSLVRTDTATLRVR